MDIREFVDLKELEAIQIAWSNVTGLASIFTDAKGEYITGDCNFTDFCIKYTRGTKEGLRRCVDTDQHGLERAGLEQGCYKCHAGLMDFGYPIRIRSTGEVVMTAIGGQVMPSDQPVDDEAIRKLSREIGVDAEEYVEAFHKINSMPEERIRACADLLGMAIEIYVNGKYEEYTENVMLSQFEENLEKVNGVIDRIEDNSKKLTRIASKEGILALNSAIEAARLGTAGASFSILAKQQSDLSKQSEEIYGQIGADIAIISSAVDDMNAITGKNNDNLLLDELESEEQE